MNTKAAQNSKKSDQAWITGQVVQGNGRGRALGFPTANLVLEQQDAAPGVGIYACWARVQGVLCPAVAHIGPRPTFRETKTTIEVHILDFPDEDLYGEIIAFHCIGRIRDVMRFDSAQELSAAIHQDCLQARRILHNP